MTKTIKIKTLFLALLFCLGANAQINLVPNPSFEIHDTCPSNESQTRFATGWSIYRNFAPYYNSCSIPSYIYDPFSVGIPANGGGYQYAFDGQAYIGMFTYVQQTADNRAAVGCKLTTTLAIGTKYYVSFWANLGAIDSAAFYNTATDHLGALFSKVPFSYANPSPKNNFAHVYGQTIITDTLNWTKISGSFIADSAYQYMAIGNFFDNANTNKIFFYAEPAGGDSSAVYFIDKICVSTDSSLCNPITSIKQYYINGNVNIYPNPADTYFTIKTNDPMQLTMYNNLGEKITQQKLLIGNNIISTISYPSGIYFLELNSNQGIIREKIIINNHP